MKNKLIPIFVMFFALILFVSGYTADSYVDVESTLQNGYTADAYTSIDSTFGSDETAADTCSCPISGDWVIQCSDNCDIQACNMQTNNVIVNGTGSAYGLINITNATEVRIQGGCYAHAK